MAGCGDDGKTVSIVESSLDFGKTDCGTTAVPRSLVVSNPSGTAFNFTTALALGDASPYLVVPDRGAVLPNRQLELTIYSKAIPQTADIADNKFGDTLTLTTDEAGDTPHAIAITQTAHGAVLTVSTNTVAFADSTPVESQSQPLPLKVTNTGNAAVALSFAGDPTFMVMPAGPTMLAAGGSVDTMVRYTPATLGVIAADLGLHVDGPVCQAAPMVVATASSNLKGTARAVAIASVRGKPSKMNQPAMCFVIAGGHVACTGRGDFGMRGDGTQSFSTSSYSLVKTTTGNLDGVVSLVAGRGYFCARRSDTTEWCWGDFLGLGQEAQSDPTRTNLFATEVGTGISDHAAGYSTHCALAAGTVTCSSQNTGSNPPASTWTVANATAVTLHSSGGYALLGDGTVMSFGENSRGERGNIDAAEAPPSLVTGLTDVVQVSAGAHGNGLRHQHNHGCARKLDGSLWCWGNNNHGQLGNGSTSDTSTPAQVMVDGTTPLAAASSLSTTGSHGCALVADSVWCWGNNKHGQLGVTATGDQPFAAQTSPALSGVARVDVGGLTSCAVLTTGGVRCWGRLADGLDHNTPTMLPVFEP